MKKTHQYRGSFCEDSTCAAPGVFSSRARQCPGILMLLSQTKAKVNLGHKTLGQIKAHNTKTEAKGPSLWSRSAVRLPGPGLGLCLQLSSNQMVSVSGLCTFLCVSLHLAWATGEVGNRAKREKDGLCSYYLRTRGGRSKPAACSPVARQKVWCSWCPLQTSWGNIENVTSGPKEDVISQAESTCLFPGCAILRNRCTARLGCIPLYRQQLLVSTCRFWLN